MWAKAGTDELIAFVGARLAETASQAELFHEPACPAVASGEPGPRTAVPGDCDCPVPRQIRDRAVVLRSLLDDEHLDSPATTHFHTGTHHPAYGERELHRSLPLLLGALFR